jgi:hypothetical protein
VFPGDDKPDGFGLKKNYLVAPEKGGIENKNPHFLVFLLRFLD